MEEEEEEEEEEEAAAEARRARRRACVSSREEEEDRREGGFMRVVRTGEGFLIAYVRVRKRVSVCTSSLSPGSECALLVFFLGRSAAAAALGREEPAESPPTTSWTPSRERLNGLQRG